MKATITDVVSLRALRPLEVATYLRSRGWQAVHDDGNAVIWRLSEGHADVRLPSNDRYADFPLRMSELLKTVAHAEQRSELEVLRDILSVQTDLLRVRSETVGAAQGTLPLDQGVAFVERSRDMVLAAACATIGKRPYFARRKPQRAMDYLGTVRLGQTEHGSYVLTILSPVAPELRPAQGTLLPTEPDEPYERQVVRTLLESLEALAAATHVAAVRGEMAAFTTAVEKGVSSNLCDAIVGISRATAGTLSVDVAWSPSRPVGLTPARVQFAADATPIIEEASRLLREAAPVEDFELEGFVTRLHRGAEAANGDVTIHGFVEGQPRTVVVTLGTNDYRRATTAHGDRLLVRCVGELIREGRSFRLNNPRQFQIVAPEATPQAN